MAPPGGTRESAAGRAGPGRAAWCCAEALARVSRGRLAAAATARYGRTGGEAFVSIEKNAEFGPGRPARAVRRPLSLSGSRSTRCRFALRRRRAGRPAAARAGGGGRDSPSQSPRECCAGRFRIRRHVADRAMRAGACCSPPARCRRGLHPGYLLLLRWEGLLQSGGGLQGTGGTGPSHCTCAAQSRQALVT